MKEGKPTLTPLPPDWSPKEANNNNNNSNSNNAGPTATPVPTLAPPLAEPANWQAVCGPTTNPQKPFGIKVSWNAVPGAARYAIRIDEDAPSWEGDTPSPGDTVANEVKETVFVREAKAGAVYQWWVHTVNVSGVYSKLTMKKVIKCPEPNAAANQASKSAGSVGAGELIVLP